MSPAPPATRRVGLLLYDEVQLLDVSGPLDVFATANQLNGRPAYECLTLAPDGTTCVSESGLRMLPDCSLDAAPPLDTLLIPGGEGSRRLDQDPRLLAWIVAQAARSQRVVSVCTGLYLLAATGLLDGRRATTHWRFAADLQRRYPRIQVEASHLFLCDGPYWSSGGLTAGMDLALALVQADLGRPLALRVARELVMYMQRPGDQLQYSEPLQAQTDASGPLARLPDWLLAHLHERLDSERMAEAMAMSPRNFRRVFRQHFGCSPQAHLESLRLGRACDLLTTSAVSISRLAERCGFASADSFRRAFRRRLGCSPEAYRERF